MRGAGVACRYVARLAVGCAPTGLGELNRKRGHAITLMIRLVLAVRDRTEEGRVREKGKQGQVGRGHADPSAAGATAEDDGGRTPVGSRRRPSQGTVAHPNVRSAWFHVWVVIFHRVYDMPQFLRFTKLFAKSLPKTAPTSAMRMCDHNPVPHVGMIFDPVCRLHTP